MIIKTVHVRSSHDDENTNCHLARDIHTRDILRFGVVAIDISGMNSSHQSLPPFLSSLTRLTKNQYFSIYHFNLTLCYGINNRGMKLKMHVTFASLWLVKKIGCLDSYRWNMKSKMIIERKVKWSENIALVCYISGTSIFVVTKL